MRPFLLVSTRPEEEAIEAELRSYLRVSQLEAGDIEQVRFDLGTLPDIDVHEYSGIFVAGSPYDTTSTSKSATQIAVEEELEHLFRDIADSGIPCLATGYGMEVATTVLGGEVTTHWAEPPSVVDIDLTEEGREDPLLDGFPYTGFHCYVSHHEAVETPPDGAVVLAKSYNCPVQVMKVADNFYATQFNPDIDSDAIEAQLQKYEDAGYSGTGDLGSLQIIGRYGAGTHQAGQLIRNFVKMYAAN